MEAQLSILLLLSLGIIITAEDFKASETLDERIIGGHNAPPRPEFGSIRKANLVHICTATIISNRKLLTAAHCCFTSWAVVTVGSNDLSSPRSTIYSISRCAYHPSYRQGTPGNDIAVVTVSPIMKLDSYVKIMPLPSFNCPPGKYYISGWGNTDLSKPGPNLLQELLTMSYSSSDCKRIYNLIITYNETCIYTKIGEGSCYGDSGGPMHAGRVCGVISRGKACAIGYPDIITLTYPYLSWIKSEMLT